MVHPIVWLAVLGLAFLVIYYNYPKAKSNFKISKKVSLEPLPNNLPSSNEILFKGENFANLVESPVDNSIQKIDKMPEYSSTEQLLGHGNMTETGKRDISDSFNARGIAAVNISRNHLQTDCVSATFNIGSGVGVEPVSSVHHFVQKYSIPASMITNTEYQTPEEAKFYNESKILSIQHV